MLVHITASGSMQKFLWLAFLFPFELEPKPLVGYPKTHLALRFSGKQHTRKPTNRIYFGWNSLLVAPGSPLNFSDDPRSAPGQGGRVFKFFLCYEQVPALMLVHITASGSICSVYVFSCSMRALMFTCTHAGSHHSIRIDAEVFVARISVSFRT